MSKQDKSKKRIDENQRPKKTELGKEEHRGLGKPKVGTDNKPKKNK
jgi:hypothetical protein